jgi:hypothetical protein
VVQIWIGGRSTNLGASSTARISNRSTADNRFAGGRPAAGAATGTAGWRVAVERGSPVSVAAARVVTPAWVSSV